MMAAEVRKPHLIERLPAVRGRLAADQPLANVTRFAVGGPAEAMFRPADLDDLMAFLGAKPADVPVTVIGVGSNLLVRDGGVKGVVIRLGRAFAAVRTEGDTVEAGAGALDLNVALTAREAEIAGLEFLCGIPGTVGGALRMNAGAYAREIKDVLAEARALDEAGGLHRLSAEACGFAYRESQVPGSWIFVAATFQGRRGERAAIARRMAEIATSREASQPVRGRTGGSTFKNPPGGKKAWQLIDEAGCRGLRQGGALVSEKHCNFLINAGTATAADIEALGEEVRRRVLEQTGVALEWEIRRIGVPLAAARAKGRP